MDVNSSKIVIVTLILGFVTVILILGFVTVTLILGFVTVYQVRVSFVGVWVVGGRQPPRYYFSKNYFSFERRKMLILIFHVRTDTTHRDYDIEKI